MKKSKKSALKKGKSTKVDQRIISGTKKRDVLLVIKG